MPVNDSVTVTLSAIEVDRVITALILYRVNMNDGDQRITSTNSALEVFEQCSRILMSRIKDSLVKE